MNIQTDPKRLQRPAHHFPAAAEQPIRAHFLHEDRLRALGESLARNEVVSFHGLEPFDFQARIRENAAKILEVYRSTNAAQARGDMVTPAAQWLLDNNYLVEETIFQIKRDLPRRFYRELPTLTLAGRHSRCRARWRSPGSMSRIPTAPSRRQMFKAIVEGYPVGRAAEDRRIVGAAVAAALRPDRKPAPHRGPGEPGARDAADRQRRRRPRARLGRRRRPEGHPGGLRGACARHDLRHATALQAARRLAECRQSA